MRGPLLFVALVGSTAGCVSDFDPTADGGGTSAATDTGPASDPSGASGPTDATGNASASDGGPGDGGSSGVDTQGSGKHHPEGYADAAVHGLAMKIHEEDCRVCHGEDLMGGISEISCDSCHQPEWRTDCVYCHGGDVDMTGAPPRDIDGTTDVASLSFIPHGKHIAGDQHPTYACTECHVQPTDVLTLDHVFDSTDAEAEVEFGAGLSAAGTWDGASSCSNLYCHGNGRGDNGSYLHSDPAPDCGGCHPYGGTANTAYITMSGEHRKHIVDEAVTCQECHALTDNGGEIGMAILHVDGKADVEVTEPGLSYDAGGNYCTGTCHNHNHVPDEDW